MNHTRLPLLILASMLVMLGLGCSPAGEGPSTRETPTAQEKPQTKENPPAEKPQPCDGKRLETTLAQLTPEVTSITQRRKIASQGLLDACPSIPDALKVPLRFNANLATPDTPQPRLESPSKADLDEQKKRVGEACSLAEEDALDLLSEASSLTVSQRSTLFFKRCQFGRFGFVDEDTFASAGGPITVLVILHWLQTHGGLSKETLYPVLEEILWESAVPDGAKLPAGRPDVPLKSALVLEVRMDAVVVNERQVGTLDAGKVTNARLWSFARFEFSHVAKREDELARLTNKGPSTKRALIVADRDVPWETLFNAFQTAHAEGYKPEMAVAHTRYLDRKTRASARVKGPVGLVEIAPPSHNKGDLINIHIRSESVELIVVPECQLKGWESDPIEDGDCRQVKKAKLTRVIEEGSKPAATQVAAALAEMVKKVPTVASVIVSADAEIPLKKYLAIHEAVRYDAAGEKRPLPVKTGPVGPVMGK